MKPGPFPFLVGLNDCRGSENEIKRPLWREVCHSFLPGIIVITKFSATTTTATAMATTLTSCESNGRQSRAELRSEGAGRINSDFLAGSFGSHSLFFVRFLFLRLPSLPPSRRRRADLAQKNGKQRNFIACNVVVNEGERELPKNTP